MTPADPDRIATEMSARCGSGAPVAVRLLDVGFDDGGFVGAVDVDGIWFVVTVFHRIVLFSTPVPFRSDHIAQQGNPCGCPVVRGLGAHKGRFSFL